MENASKALIIAGAILLAILIIALGIMVYNNASSTVSSADMSDTDIQAFNQKFTQYLSTSMSANDIDGLLNQVQSSNLAEYKSGTGRYVGVTVTGIAAGSTSSTTTTYGSTTEGTYSAITSITEYSAAKTYKGVETLSSSTGLVYLITITTN